MIPASVTSWSQTEATWPRTGSNPSVAPFTSPVVTPDNVVRSLKKIRLEVRTVDGRQMTTLPYEWSESGAAAALSPIQQIAKRFDSGDAITLKAAAQGAETASSRQRTNGMELVNQFRKTRPTAGDVTWKNKYLPALVRVSACLEGKNKPKYGADLAKEGGPRAKKVF